MLLFMIMRLILCLQSRQKRTVGILNLLRIQLFPTPILPHNFIFINVQVKP